MILSKLHRDSLDSVFLHPLVTSGWWQSQEDQQTVSLVLDADQAQVFEELLSQGLGFQFVVIPSKHDARISELINVGI